MGNKYLELENGEVVKIGREDKEEFDAEIKKWEGIFERHPNLYQGETNDLPVVPKYLLPELAKKFDFIKRYFDKENVNSKEKILADVGYNSEKENEDLKKECFVFIAGRYEDDASELIVETIEKRFDIYTTRDDVKSEIWIYDDGIYKPNGECFIKEFVRNVLEKLYTPQRANKVISKIETDTMIETDEFFDVKYLNEICVENGILNLETKTLSEFTPKKIFFNKMPVCFNPTAECPAIDKFFSEILRSSDDKKILYELAGFCLHKDYFIEKAFMFVGDGRNGKGKTISLLKSFVGVKNICSVKLSQMEPRNTALCELHNRMVNLAGDLSNTALKDTGLFKELTARDPVQVKRKYLRELMFVNYAKMVFACNELPRVYDLSEGFWSRWIVLEFPYQFLPIKEIELKSEKDRKVCKEQDPWVIEKITTDEELSGLLNKAIEGLFEIKKQRDFSYSRGTNEVKNFWIRKSDSFTAFCLDKLIGCDERNGWITKKELRKEFNIYCKEHRIKGTSDINIKVVLEGMFGVTEGRKREDIHNPERVFCWDGIKFKS